MSIFEMSTISFSNPQYGIAKVMPEKVGEVIKKYIEREGIENVFVDNKPYLGKIEEEKEV